MAPKAKLASAKPAPAKPAPAAPAAAPAAPGQPEAKAPPPEEQEAGLADFPFNIASRRTMWSILALLAIIGIVFLGLVVHTYLYWKSVDKLPVEEPMRKLRRTMAVGLRNRNVNYENYVKTANEVQKLPEHIDKSEKELKKQKKKYRTLFNKVTKSVNGWDIYGNNLYYISESKKSWFDAENFCQSRDSHLTSILTSEEQNYISAQMGDPFWIGLTDENVEGSWEWSDGSQVTTGSWARSKQNFSSGQEAAERDCVFLEHSSGKSLYSWKDGNCHELKRWVCKEPITVANDRFN